MLVHLESKALAALVEALADFTLVVSPEGRVVEVKVASEEIGDAVDQSWVGRGWGETLRPEGQTRLQELRTAAEAHPGTPMQCDVVHILPDNGELPVQYKAVYLPDEGRLLALGRDLRPLASLRQQLLNAQQTLEQDYWRLRQVETRYRRVFEMVGEAALVVDGDSLRVLEANPVASELLGAGQSVVGKPFPQGLDERSKDAVNRLLEEIRTVGKGSLSSVRTADADQRLTVTASFLRQAGEARFLLRMAPLGDAQTPAAGQSGPVLPETLRLAPDAVLLTDADGRVQAANRAFLELAQLLSEEQAIGQMADRWVGRSGVDLNVLLTNLRQRDAVRLFASTLRGESGTTADVEISACRIDDTEPTSMAFFIRDIGRRVRSEHPMTQQLPKSIEQVTGRVGRVPLKDLVRESKDVIEALCVEAALKLTHDNRASAAELLGLSRQSLYAKLRRYGIGGADSDGNGTEDD